MDGRQYLLSNAATRRQSLQKTLADALKNIQKAPSVRDFRFALRLQFTDLGQGLKDDLAFCWRRPDPFHEFRGSTAPSSLQARMMQAIIRF
jgi:hypothetical protein